MVLHTVLTTPHNTPTFLSDFRPKYVPIHPRLYEAENDDKSDDLPVHN